VIDAEGSYLLPGVIDTHVHFRDPGLTHKADFATESAAAVVGGVTSVVDMPNTKPQTTTRQLLDDKKQMAAQKSVVNYGFMLGATNDNIDELLAIDKAEYAAIKLFLGSSTGNMLVNNDAVLDRLFAEASKLIVAHCEDEDTIVANTQRYKDMYGDDAPASVHAMIRDVEACYRSSKKAVELARKFNTRFHLAHLSTAKELELLSIGGVEAKNITAEVSPNHLWFSADDYATLGNKIRCNPSIKSAANRDALLQALKEGRIDMVATDHAPHLIEEKERPYFQSVSGMPSLQHSLLTMLELSKQGKISLETMVEKMSHNPATLFGIEGRGFIRQGYYADMVLVNPNETTLVDKPSLLYKCGWSPMEGYVFANKIVKTFVNGNLVYSDGIVNGTAKGMPLSFAN
jgi:dihydroorotase